MQRKKPDLVSELKTLKKNEYKEPKKLYELLHGFGHVKNLITYENFLRKILIKN